MKKRVLSTLLAFAMLIVSMSTVFAAPIDITGKADDVYEGNKPFVLAEKLLDQLNDDEKADIFDKRAHEYQTFFSSGADLDVTTDDLSEAIEHLAPIEGLSDYQKMYLYAQVKAESDPAFKAELDAIDPVGGLSLKESFGLLDNYVNDMMGFLNSKGIRPEDYNGVATEARTIIAEPLGAILSVMFADDGTSDDSSDYTESGEYMRENYLKEFIANDRAKKTLSVLFGAELTAEIVRDSFLPGVGNYDPSQDPNKTVGIVHHVKKYFEENPYKLANFKTKVENGILVPGTKDAVDGAFKVLGELVVAAYEYDTQASSELKADVKMLMGDGTDKGLMQLMVEAIDDEDFNASSIWINLFISEFVQTYVSNVPLKTIDADNPKPTAVKIENGNPANFKNENLSDFGIENGDVTLGSSYFTLKFYVKENAENISLMASGGAGSGGAGGGGGAGGSSGSTVSPVPGGEFSNEHEMTPEYEGYVESSYITYDKAEGKILISYDSSKADEYDAYAVLYRSDKAYNETFVESYPVKIVNRAYSSGGSGSRPNVGKEYIHFDTNGGNVIGSIPYTKGETIDLTMVPTRDGYKFTGWYLDEALTQKVESITPDGKVTLYAGWVKDGSTVVSKVDVPQQLNGEDHYAYVIGYPDGDVRPYGNITRAETVTILFRLLKDDVRTANITTENAFTDVNESDWFNQAVSTLAAMNIVNGRTATAFEPNAYITRAEFATIFARFAEYSYSAEDNFGDIKGHWAEEYIKEAAAYGWIAGYEDETFRPNNLITRAESMTLINRVLKRVPENTDDLLPEMSVWTDNTDTSMWYYIAVQEATNSHKFTMKNSSNEKWTELTENRDWTVYEK